MFDRLKNFILNNSDSYNYYKNKYNEIELIKKNNNQFLNQVINSLDNNYLLLSKLEHNLNNNMSNNENFLQINELINNNTSINKLLNKKVLDDILSDEFWIDYNIIKESNLFDEEWYVKKYPQVKYLDMDSITHYLLTWKTNMNDPASFFSTKSYYLFHNDVEVSGINPFVHYIQQGMAEGRQIFPSGLYINEFDKQYIYDQLLIRQNVTNLRLNADNGYKINVVFIFFKSYWVYDMLYNLFDNDDLFNVTLIITPNMVNFTEEEIAEYNDMYNYFKSNGFNIIKGYDEISNKTIDLELECSPDIVFYGSDWLSGFPKLLQPENISQSILICYVPYSFMVSELLDSHCMNSVLIRKAWKFFCSTEFIKQRIIDKNLNNLDPGKLIVSYYPKIDGIFLNCTDDDFWEKTMDFNGNAKKRIIWAPHWTITENLLNYSTFNYNYEFFYEYANANPNIEWIFRPHPLLKNELIKSGLMSVDEVDQYYQKWDDLPNAKYYFGPDYASMYKNSDAMITDSGSFIAEYLMCNKPGLKLDSDTQRYNDFANLALDCWYRCDGGDFESIEKFINDVVICDNDSLKKQRTEFVNNNLIPKGDLTASEIIFNYIKSNFSKNE